MPSLIPRWLLFPGFVLPAPWASQGLDRPPNLEEPLGRSLPSAGRQLRSAARAGGRGGFQTPCVRRGTCRKGLCHPAPGIRGARSTGVHRSMALAGASLAFPVHRLNHRGGEIPKNFSYTCKKHSPGSRDYLLFF